MRLLEDTVDTTELLNNSPDPAPVVCFLREKTYGRREKQIINNRLKERAATLYEAGVLMCVARAIANKPKFSGQPSCVRARPPKYNALIIV